jgi:hypothetical protein
MNLLCAPWDWRGEKGGTPSCCSHSRFLHEQARRQQETLDEHQRARTRSWRRWRTGAAIHLTDEAIEAARLRARVKAIRRENPLKYQDRWPTLWHLFPHIPLWYVRANGTALQYGRRLFHLRR